MTHATTRTVVLVLTDLVDSTALVASLGDAGAAELWARHDREARRLVARHGGREIDKSDGFLLLFEAAAAAAAFAEAYHRALAGMEPPLRARVGLHVGEVALVETPADDVARGAKPLEVEGIAKSLTARVMSVAAGGQTLATPAAVEALGDPPGEGRVALSHGHWRLKGLEAPIELFEVGRPGEAPLVPPPDAAKAWRVVRQGDVWLPVREVPHTLPAERDRFVGRGADLREIAARFEAGARLVTLTGIGGTGKTRLATRFAWTWLGEWPGGAWFCELTEARSPEGITHAVAGGLGVQAPGGHAVKLLGLTLRDRGPCLLVLDNFEQVARHAPATLGAWLDAAPEARFLVTSREILGLPGEVLIPLSPLEPDAALDLFATRAAAVAPAFALNEANTPTVRELVALLDHLPLAIELAAARARIMSPATLLERMSRRFELLRAKGRHDRHATLRAALEWSWELLAPEEQAGLAQLTVFEGGFDLEAAEAVLEVGDAWPVEVVQSLVDKSLVRPVGEERFTLLVSVRAFAAEHLRDREATEARHERYFAAWGDPDAEAGRSPRDQAHDLENLVAACERGIERLDEHVVYCTIRALFFLPLHNEVKLRLAEAAVTQFPVGTRGWKAGIQVRSDASYLLGRHDISLDSNERRLRAARAKGDLEAMAPALTMVGRAHATLGRLDEARACYGEAREALKGASDAVDLGILLNNEGWLAMYQGRMQEAEAKWEEGLELARRIGSGRLELLCLYHLATYCYRESGRLDGARASFSRLVRMAEETASPERPAIHGDYGLTLLHLGRLHDARAELEQALELAERYGHLGTKCGANGHLGLLHALSGRPAEARTHLRRSLELADALGRTDNLLDALCALAELALREGDLEGARDHLAAIRARSSADGGGAMRLAAHARGLEGEVARRAGDLAGARRLLEEAIRAVQEVRDRHQEGRWLTALARVLLESGEPAEAWTVLHVAEPMVREVGDPCLVAELLAARAELVHRDGEVERARELLVEAERTAPKGFVWTRAEVDRVKVLIEA